MSVAAQRRSTDDHVVSEVEDALQIAVRSGDDHSIVNVRLTLGVVLVQSNSDEYRTRGRDLLDAVGKAFMERRRNLHDLHVIRVLLARERARAGDRDGAIQNMRAAVDHLARERLFIVLGVDVFVRMLIERSGPGDLAEAEAAMQRLAEFPANGWVLPELTLLRLNALLARAHGDDDHYRDYRDRYREMANTLGFEGHIEWADGMP